MTCRGVKAVFPPPFCSKSCCGIGPRRDPLLGQTDSQECKSSRAFTWQATQGIWDLGSLSLLVKEQSLQSSKFRQNLISGKYPFMLDHSGGINEKKIAWFNEIEFCNVVEMLPELVEGLTDSHPIYSTIASLAITDIMKHSAPENIIGALPKFKLAVKSALRFNNRTIARRIMKVITNLCKCNSRVGPYLTPHMHGLLMHLNQWTTAETENGDRIAYSQRSKPQLNECIDTLVDILQAKAGTEINRAEINIKRAIPTFAPTRIVKRG